MTTRPRNAVRPGEYETPTLAVIHARVAARYRVEQKDCRGIKYAEWLAAEVARQEARNDRLSNTVAWYSHLIRLSVMRQGWLMEEVNRLRRELGQPVVAATGTGLSAADGSVVVDFELTSNKETSDGTEVPLQHGAD